MFMIAFFFLQMNGVEGLSLKIHLDEDLTKEVAHEISIFVHVFTHGNRCEIC